MSKHYARLPDGETAEPAHTPAPKRCRNHATGVSVDAHVASHITKLTADDWRKITEGLTRRFSGDFPLDRNGASVNWRTQRERAAISILALDPRIDSIEGMPERVTLMVNGRQRVWSPALRITSGRRVVMADVIREATATAPERQHVTELLTRTYAERGITYTTMLEGRVCREPRLANARFVLGYRGVDCDPDTELAVVGALSRGGEVTLGSLEAQLVGFGDVRATVFAMATRKQVRLDLWAPDFASMEVLLVSWECMR